MRDTTFQQVFGSDFSERLMEMAWRERKTDGFSVGKVPLANPSAGKCVHIARLETALKL